MAAAAQPPSPNQRRLRGRRCAAWNHTPFFNQYMQWPWLGARGECQRLYTAACMQLAGGGGARPRTRPGGAAAGSCAVPLQTGLRHWPSVLEGLGRLGWPKKPFCSSLRAAGDAYKGPAIVIGPWR